MKHMGGGFPAQMHLWGQMTQDFIDLQSNADMALRMVAEAKELVYDTEGSGLDWRRNVNVGYVFTVDNDSVYVPVRHGGGGNLVDPTGACGPLLKAEPGTDGWKLHPFERALAKAFDARRAAKLPTIGHNIQFDCHTSLTTGITLGRELVCTQNNQTLIDEHTRGYSLEKVAEYYKVQAKKSEEMYAHLGRVFNATPNRNLMGRFWELSGVDPVAYDYATGDGVTTQEVWYKQRDRIADEELHDIWRVEGQLIWSLVKMERRGIPLDLEYLDKLVRFIGGKVEEAKASLPPDFNPRSPTAMKELMEKHGHTDWPMTEPTKRFPEGSPSFTAKWLKTHEIGRAIVGLKEWTNLLNSFVVPLRDEHQYAGYINANIRQNASDEGGTITGRLACSGPNLQAVPKHNFELAARLRRAFVAERGMLLYEADYSQAEPRMYAHYSKDANLVEGYSQKPARDVHTIVAEMFNVDRKTTGKRMNMGMFTGMQVNTFSEHMGWDKAKAAEMWNRWYTLFPGVRAFQSNAKAVMLSRGFVKTILGRRARIEDRRFAYKAVSRIIQGGNADIMKYKIVQIDRWLEESGIDYVWLVMTVHDSLMWMAEDSERGVAVSEKIAEMMADVQTAPFNMRVPFEVEVDSGHNWAEATFGEGGVTVYSEVEAA